jgi:hypothetical protein
VRVVRKVFFGLVVFGVFVFLSGVSFAQTAPTAGDEVSTEKAKPEAIMKVLQDSAAALQAINPDLAMKLTNIVNENTQENTVSSKLVKDSAGWKAKHEAVIKVLQDSAAALRAINPDLAMKLTDIVDWDTKENMVRSRNEARIELLQDSAIALQAINPDLAMKLTNIVNENTHMASSKSVKDSAEWKAKRDVRMQLYKDAAAALQATNPDLAKRLIDIEIPKQKTEAQKMDAQNAAFDLAQAVSK